VIIQFTSLDTLPPLAWIAVHKKGSEILNVVAGKHVSSQEGIFWEGVNVCPGDPRKISTHHLSLVTGGMSESNSAVFFTPGHPLDRLFFSEIEGSFYISNSLPFLLAESRNELSPDYLHYAFHFRMMVENIQTMPSRHGAIGILTRANIRIDENNAISVEQKEHPPGFSCFDSYIARINEWLHDLKEALYHRCNEKYRPITTISSGYDSPAVSVLVKGIGVVEALTIEDSRQGGANSTDDSGTEIAERLGLTTIGISRSAYRRHGFEAEVVFNFGGNPDDLPFYAFKDRLAGTVVFNGVHGDTVWNRVTANRQWRRLDACGASMQEFRLRTGFIHAPLPFFGCDAQASIIAISQSEQMENWTLWNGYDRPIPRRIVEGAGVGRELFGVKKRAITVAVGIDGADYIKPKDFHTSSELKRRLIDHLNRNRSARLWFKMLLGNIIHSSIHGVYQAFHAIKRRRNAAGDAGQSVRKAANKANLKTRYDKQSRFRWKYVRPFNEHCFAAQVANTHLTTDYLKALNAHRSNRENDARAA
jgi:hypothetical protein